MSVKTVIKSALKDYYSMRLASARHGSRHWAVLCMHEVTDSAGFISLLDTLQESYEIVSLTEGFAAIRSGAAARPLLSLTFDDADKTVWLNCLPELRRRSLPACLFVCTGFVDAGFRDVSTGRFEVMTWEDLKDWADAGLEVGAHTVNHIPLNQATLERGKWEVMKSKHDLEDRLHCAVRHFAYPWGYYKDELDRWLQEDDAFLTISTTLPVINYPARAGKHVHRKPAHWNREALQKELKSPTLYQTVRAAHQRSVLNGLAPVMWRLDAESPLIRD